MVFFKQRHGPSAYLTLQTALHSRIFKSVTTEIKSMIDPCFSKFVFEPDDILVQKPSSVLVLCCAFHYLLYFTPSDWAIHAEGFKTF